jgi:hypothetical protein
MRSTSAEGVIPGVITFGETEQGNLVALLARGEAFGVRREALSFTHILEVIASA